ncbi:MAG: hypothetical protein II536_04040 [Clostridia bacterium]|nr:hypothetical protein [Clostridia bacterium]MBQ4341031.1 hypothetical protein [Clostridia bacterium]
MQYRECDKTRCSEAGKFAAAPNAACRIKALSGGLFRLLRTAPAGGFNARPFKAPISKKIKETFFQTLDSGAKPQYDLIIQAVYCFSGHKFYLFGI